MKLAQSNNTRKLSITIAIVLFLISLTYALYQEYGPLIAPEEVAKSTEKIPEYFDYGTIADSSYCNDFFEFSIPISKGHQASYKKYDYIEKSFYVKDSVPATPKLTAAITDQGLLLIEPELVKIDWLKNLKETNSLEDFRKYSSEKSKREQFGSDYQLVISAHKLSESSLSSYINLFENLHNPNYGNSKTKMVSGIPFREYEGLEKQGDPVQSTMFSLMGGKNRTIISYFTEINGFALSIDLFYKTEKQKRILLEMVDTIHFK
ncbi:hypothetical protein N9954_02180 [Maribacter sp.]|nr:hypothetical protein [Maribacter sp.]